MKTDSLSCRFFKEFPDCFFELVGRPATDAERYRFDAIELKDTAVRIDGVYTPQPPDEREPVFFVEYQNHRSERTYSNLLLKIGFYLEKINPRQDWHGAVIYPSRSVEQKNLHPYRWLIQSDQLTRIFLEDLTETPAETFGFGILRLIGSAQTAAVEAGRQLIAKVRVSGEVAEKRRDLIELIETVVSYRLPHLSREELEKMLHISEFRQTRIYQEAREEGIETVARRMLEQKFPHKKIVQATGLSLAAVKRLQKSQGK